MNAKQAKALFFCLLLIVGLQTFYIAVFGFATTPFYDAKYDIMRCPDWEFHECYADCLDVVKCSWNPVYDGGRPNYEFYMPFPHLVTKALSVVSGLPVLFWLAMLVAAAVTLLAALLWQHSKNRIGSAVSIFMFFVGLPAGLILVFNNPVYTWLDVVLCGTIPFILASTLFAFLILEARNLSFTKSFIVFVLIIMSHNYGFALAFMALGCLMVDVWSKGRLKAEWVALTAVFLWVVVFSQYYFSFSSERLIFLLYFLVSLELGRWVSRVKA